MLLKHNTCTSYIRSYKLVGVLAWKTGDPLHSVLSPQDKQADTLNNWMLNLTWAGKEISCLLLRLAIFISEAQKTNSQNVAQRKTITVAYNPKHWLITVDSPARMHNLFQARNLLFNLQWLYLHTCVSMLRKWITQVECVAQSLKTIWVV